MTEAHAGDLVAVAKLQDVGTSDTLCEKDNPVVLSSIKFPSPVLSLAVVAKNKGDDDKIGVGLTRFTEEDPTFTVEKNAETHDLLVSGMGDLHLEVVMSRLQKKFGVETILNDPRIPYRETIRGTAKAQGRHKKQSGGRGQFGDVWIEYEPLPSGSGLEFVDKIFGGAVPRNYIPAVEKACQENCVSGPVAGYPVVDIKCTLVDGSYHPCMTQVQPLLQA
jgi:elongation factor G